MSEILKLLEEATRSVGTGNTKNAITKIIEAVKLAIKTVDAPYNYMKTEDYNYTKTEANKEIENAVALLIPAEIDDPDFRAIPDLKTADEAVKDAQTHLEKMRTEHSPRKTVSKPFKKSGEPKKKPGPKPKKKIEEPND